MIFRQNWSAVNLTKADGTFPAEVPGNVQYDYAVSHNFPDYQYADNYKLFETLEDDCWLYSAELSYHAEADEKVFFHSDGIDYRCEISINGTRLLSHEGSFSHIDVDLTPYLKGDNDRLEVRILPHPKRPDAVGRSQADQVAKAPVCYGWGWHPRLLISGMWQDAWIETRKKDYIYMPSVTYKLRNSFTSADVTASWECAGDVSFTLLDPSGKPVYKGRRQGIFTLDDIELWWCNGQGDQPLYTWIMESGSDRKTGKVGFKSGKLVMNEGSWNEPAEYPKSRSDAPATYELNGRRIFLKGTNFLTPDIFTGRVTEETLRKQITLARDANMNVFRCWGGCGCQKEAFYDICDELGILVWVEFPLACNLYSEEDAYLDILKQEAAGILLSLRKHPSVAFWCGGNELFNNWSGMTEQHLALRLLDSLCYLFDRDRPFIMTSPLNGMAHGNYFFDEGSNDVFSLFRNSHDTTYTEFGPTSLISPTDVEKILPPESRTFPFDDNDRSWQAHYGTQNNPERCRGEIQKYFPDCTSLEEAIEYSDLMQSMGYKAIFEEARRQWPHCSMALNWCYNEPWHTTVNRNLIDYDSLPRASYFAVKDSLRPVLFTAGIPHFLWKAGELFTADIVLHNDTDQPVKRAVKAVLSLGTQHYDLLNWEADCAPEENFPGPTVRLRLPDTPDEKFMTLTLTSDDGSVNSYTLRYLPKPKPPVLKRLNE